MRMNSDFLFRLWRGGRSHVNDTGRHNFQWCLSFLFRFTLLASYGWDKELNSTTRTTKGRIRLEWSPMRYQRRTHTQQLCAQMRSHWYINYSHDVNERWPHLYLPYLLPLCLAHIDIVLIKLRMSCIFDIPKVDLIWQLGLLFSFLFATAPYPIYKYK